MKTIEHSKDLYSFLYEIGKVLNSGLEIEKVIKGIVEIVNKHLGSYDFSILLVEGDKLVLKGPNNHPKWGDKSYFIPVGRGITGTVAATGKPLLVNDVTKDKRYISIKKDYMSELAVPIQVEGKVIGVFNLESKQQNAFNENHQRLISAIADHTAIAIMNASLYKSNREKIKRLTNLYNSGKIINSTLDLDTILNSLLEISAKEIKYDSIAILILEKGRLYAKAGLGFTKEEIRSYSAPIGKGICGKVAETGNALIVNDISKCSFYINQSPRTKSEMAVPIKLGNTVIGIYNVESNDLNSFDEEDMVFVSALAEQAAIAIKNAELYSEIADFNKLLKIKVDEATKELKDANRELEHLNRMKTDFVSIVSHELRTPMTSIIGYISVVKEGECGIVTEQQKEFLGIAHDESMRLYRLISDLLDIQRIESHGMLYIFKDFDFAAFFEKYNKEAMKECQQKGIQFVFNAPKEFPRVIADGDKIRQIMNNLVSNALKFTKSGKLTIEAKVLPDFVEVSVSDTGIGIPEDKLGIIFEKFRQVNMEASRQVGGTGLGLAITKGLVEAHKGKIWVKSTPGKGSTFTFTVSRNL